MSDDRDPIAVAVVLSAALVVLVAVVLVLDVVLLT